MSKNVSHFELLGKPVSVNADGLVSLTDIWRISGEGNNHKPARWLMWKESQEFVSEVENSLKVRGANLLATTKGRNGGTFAHWQIALSYAQYLSPTLHIEVNGIYARYKSGDLSLIDDVLDNNTQQAIKQNKKAGKAPALTQQQIDEQKHAVQRAQSKVTRNQHTAVLFQHGVDSRGIAMCTNNTYKPIIGCTAAQAKKAMKLPKNVGVRDVLDGKLLAAVMLSEYLSAEDIEKNNKFGNQECANSCLDASTKVASIL